MFSKIQLVKLMTSSTAISNVLRENMHMMVNVV